MNGLGSIVLGLLGFACAHIHASSLERWQWMFIILGILTFITSALLWFFFPDSPTDAWFLTPEERVKVVIRIRGDQAGVENKTFKKDQ
jgi:ACS family allantoate permease-like MFS transporter